MRKRKRQYGEYVDEDTGEVSVVQTTKQVKRNHQKTGKWYKEPTEAELRIWERDEKRQAAVDKAQRREENKKVNAAKRAEKDEKEQEVKRREFEAGRITFTQTLAKKDEDQLNLHSWFGGRPKASKNLQQPSRPRLVEKNVGENKEIQTQNKTGSVADVGVQEDEIKRDIQTRGCDENTREATDTKPEAGLKASESSSTKTERESTTTKMNSQEDLEMLESSQEFDIAEDSDPDTEILEQLAEEVEQQPEPVFKVPALPKRLPLSPMSKSDVNVRASHTTQVNSFKEKLEKASITMPSSTQAVRDLLSGICTQDLADEIDAVDSDDEPLGEDKENQDPDFDAEADCEDALEPEAVSCKEDFSKSAQMNRSFSSIADSCDYDTIFAELEDAPMDSEEHKSSDFTTELKDADLLSLPSTQLLPRATDLTKQTPLAQTVQNTSIQTKPIRKMLQKNDSFAFEGLSEDDLEVLYDQFEKDKQKSSRASAASSFMTSGSTASSLKTRSMLPWEKKLAQLADLEEQALEDDDEADLTQDYD